MRNEVTNVEAVCSELQEMMNAQSLRYDVVVVNDGSNDGTAPRTGEIRSNGFTLHGRGARAWLWPGLGARCWFSYGARLSDCGHGR